MRGEERGRESMGDGFWTEAWNPRMPDSCLFSSPLAIELIDSDQRGWRYNYSRHLHVLLTFYPI